MKAEHLSPRPAGRWFVRWPFRTRRSVQRDVKLTGSAEDWPRNGGELRGGILRPRHLESLVEVLFQHDALMHACAIDVSLEDNVRVDQHKAGQCGGITKHLTPEHHPDLVREVWDLRRVLERMPRQLYIQCVMMKELVRIASEEVTLYFAQRRPRELAKSEWIIHAKTRVVSPAKRSGGGRP